MQTINNRPTQSVSPSPVNNQPMVTEKPFSFTRRQLILISVVGGFVLLFIFGLGVRAGEKRVLRKQLVPQIQPKPTDVQTNPTIVPTPTPISAPASPSISSPESKRGEKGTSSQGTACERDVDCLSCFAVPGTPVVNCDAGRCVNGICVWPTSPPDIKKHELPETIKGE